MVQLSHPYMTTDKTNALSRQTFVSNVMSVLFHMLSRFVIVFLPRSSKCLLISWLQLPSAVILEPKKISLSLFPLFPHLFAMKWWAWMSCQDLSFWMLSFKPDFSVSSFIKRLFSSSLLSAIRVAEKNMKKMFKFIVYFIPGKSLLHTS